MDNKELLIDFLKFHYKDNPFRKESTNEKDVDSYLETRKTISKNDDSEYCKTHGHYEDGNSGECVVCGVKFIKSVI